MAKCDVCGKNSLLPEKFGAINICKLCFMKTNGLLWKHQYERCEEAEKQRNKALENAHKYNFPQYVIIAINNFFENQISKMIKCDCCNQPVQHLQPLGNTKICKQCFSKLNNSAWKQTEYEDNEEVEKNRQKVLKNASKNGFSTAVIIEINNHFDSKIQKGLICSVNNYRGQKLKVYETHCILITTDSFDIEENSKEYGKALKSCQPKESFISNSAAKSLARSVLMGGVVKAGINLATSAAINVAADALAPEKGIFKVIKGSYRLDYTDYDRIDFQKVGDNNVGFIRFRNSSYNGNPSEDIVFIFGSSDGKENAYNEITKWSTLVRQSNSSIKEELPTQYGASLSVADEILKFKNLLDNGIITQEEFDAKKKQLLGL